MADFWRQLPYATMIIGAILVGLWISNILYDAKIPNYISRKIAHAVGGFGYLLCIFLFDSGWWPFALSAGFALMLAAARVVRPETFRGAGGTGRSKNVFAEVWFPLVAVPVIGLGWIWLDKPIMAVMCLLFMAWGDCVTGLVRSQVYHKAVKGLWGSVAMLIVCCAIAWTFSIPLWVGFVGAGVATVTEVVCGDVGLIKWADDNWAIPLVSFAVVFGILAGIGAL
jgi:phytol kinase